MTRKSIVGVVLCCTALLFCGAAAAADKKTVVIPLLTKAKPVKQKYTVTNAGFIPMGTNDYVVDRNNSYDPYLNFFVRHLGSNVRRPFAADAHLPHGALITGLEVVLSREAGSPVDENVSVLLYKKRIFGYGINPPVGRVSVVGDYMYFIPPLEVTTIYRKRQTFTTPETVDTNFFAYFLMVHLPPGIRLHSCSIKYEY
ncbi:MAG: hypothetical protein CSA34_07695 [Desulfobulbus propionicus]|nr:MAG: hypothetical protein CSA34_07695 [Desulfobulbus propionicus]